jgi:ribosomal protein S27E
MAENELPAVAKSVFLDCKKCGAERYHTVLAHTSATSAKIKCEVCGATKTHKFIATKKPSKTGVVRKAKVSKADEHRLEYEKMLTQNETAAAVKYDMKLSFEVNQKVNHPKFGLGVIRMSLPEKIEVVFADEVRNLVHNRH